MPRITRSSQPLNLSAGHESVPLFVAKDLLQPAAMLALGLIAWSTPERFWSVFGRPLGFLTACLHPRRTRSAIREIKLALGERKTRLSPSLLEIRFRADKLEERLQLLREYRPDGWRPQIRVVGREHIERALDRGHGAILWVCLMHELVTKKALHQAGFSISHLSTFRHGFSNSHFGLRVINPLLISIENRYLDERIVIRLGDSLSYIRKLERKLRNNGLITISAGTGGYRTLELPFLNGRTCLATGPPNLAMTTRAALLPVFTVRRGPRDFETLIEPPLEPEARSDRLEAVECMLRQYVNSMESYVARYPVALASIQNRLVR